MLDMVITLERQRLTKLCFDQAKPLLDAKLVQELVDPRLGANYDLAEMKCCMATASLCIHHMSSKRPYMDQVNKRELFLIHIVLSYRMTCLIDFCVIYIYIYISGCAATERRRGASRTESQLNYSKITLDRCM